LRFAHNNDIYAIYDRIENNLRKRWNKDKKMVGRPGNVGCVVVNFLRSVFGKKRIDVVK